MYIIILVEHDIHACSIEQVWLSIRSYELFKPSSLFSALIVGCAADSASFPPTRFRADVT